MFQLCRDVNAVHIGLRVARVVLIKFGRVERKIGGHFHTFEREFCLRCKNYVARRVGACEIVTSSKDFFTTLRLFPVS